MPVLSTILPILGIGLLLVAIVTGVLLAVSALIGWNRLKPLREWLAHRRENRREGREREQALISPGWVITLLSLVLAGVIGIVLYTMQFTRPEAIGVGAVATAIAASSLMAGAIIGFLFGIPRSVQEDRAPRPQNETAERTQEVEYRANTNLEQISDWLTKILVGVGLTQIAKLDDGIRALSAALGPALGLSTIGQGAAVFGVASALYFLQCGFLYGYVWARVVLARAFRAADIAALGRQVARQIERKFEQQNEVDARALNLVNRILDPQPGGEPVNAVELDEAIRSASPPVKVTIFEMARGARRKGKEREAERTIPVFRALANSAPERYHRNYGQLAYALKDQTTPNWHEADAALTNAIRIRGDWQTHGYTIYELNRAICRIRTDPAFPGGPAEIQRRTAILEDLRALRQETWTRAALNDPPIAEWMRLNSVTPGELNRP